MKILTTLEEGFRIGIIMDHKFIDFLFDNGVITLKYAQFFHDRLNEKAQFNEHMQEYLKVMFPDQ